MVYGSIYTITLDIRSIEYLFHFALAVTKARVKKCFSCCMHEATHAVCSHV
jgi:hypothetical protein